MSAAWRAVVRPHDAGVLPPVRGREPTARRPRIRGQPRADAASTGSSAGRRSRRRAPAAKSARSRRRRWASSSHGRRASPALVARRCRVVVVHVQGAAAVRCRELLDLADRLLPRPILKRCPRSSRGATAADDGGRRASSIGVGRILLRASWPPASRSARGRRAFVFYSRIVARRVVHRARPAPARLHPGALERPSCGRLAVSGSPHERRRRPPRVGARSRRPSCRSVEDLAHRCQRPLRRRRRWRRRTTSAGDDGGRQRCHANRSRSR